MLCPFRAKLCFGLDFPGRCPGLYCSIPSGSVFSESAVVVLSCFRPEGAGQYSPGQRPGSQGPIDIRPERAQQPGSPPMPQSLVRNLVHLIFSTKDRASFLSDAVRPELHGYMAGIFTNWTS